MLRRMRNKAAPETAGPKNRQGNDPRTSLTGDGDDAKNKNNTYYVVIIGAGWAGLAAAKTLREKGVNNFTILEGRDYVGGRSRTVTLSDGTTTTELGSGWIHGANKANPVFAMAQKAGIQTIRTRGKTGVWSSVYAGGGGGGNNKNTAHRRVPESAVDKMYVDKMYAGHGQGFFRFQRRRQDKTDKDESLRQTLDMYIQQKGIRGDELLGLEYMVDESVSQEYAASLEDLSMWWWDTARCDKGGDVLLEQGNQNKGYTGLIDDIARPFFEKIRLNCKVTRVDYQHQDITVYYTQSGEDQQVKAHHVIVTVPLGVLKQRDIEFIPELPSEKQEAIEKLGMGALNKVILKWPDTLIMPWPQDMEWLEKIGALGTQGRWTTFHNQKSLTGYNIVTAFLAGRTAEEKEGLTDVELKNEALESLQEMFTSVAIPQPQEYIVTRWVSDPFSRGSYSYHALGCKPSHREDLRRPVLDRLFFAGEACHKGYPSTTHGAYLSGVEAANQIQA